MNDHLEKPDYTQYVKPTKIDYKRDGKCTATCREETENCQRYKLSVVFESCMFLSMPTGKCMRPDEVRK